MSQPHDHWLMKPKPSSELLGIRPDRLVEAFYPFLLHVVLPSGQRLLVREYVEALANSLDGKPLTPKLAQAFAASRQATELSERAKCQYTEIVAMHTKRRNGLNPANIGRVLGVSRTAASTVWNERLTMAARNRMTDVPKLIGPAEFMKLCPLYTPVSR